MVVHILMRNTEGYRAEWVKDEVCTDSPPPNDPCGPTPSLCFPGLRKNVLLMTWIMDECALATSVCMCESAACMQRYSITGNPATLNLCVCKCASLCYLHAKQHTDSPGYLLYGSVAVVCSPPTTPSAFLLPLCFINHLSSPTALSKAGPIRPSNWAN